MTALDKTEVYSKPVVLCIDYIYNHLYETIHVEDLAEQVHLNRNYAEIAAILAFSSQSHFIRVFRSQTGYTPKKFRNKFFRDSGQD